MVLTMAKNKPADNRFTLHEKYLARTIAAKWNSLPTVGANETGLAIQIKLSVLCTTPTDGDPIFCGREVVIYLYPIIIDHSNPTELKIGDVARDFMGDLGISWPQHPMNSKVLLQHNSGGIICEFGPPDQAYGFQSIVAWDPVADSIAQQLIAKSITVGTNIIVGLEFPQELIATRFGIVKQLKLQDWHALKLLYSRSQCGANRFYNGEELLSEALTAAHRSTPPSKKNTRYQLIHRLKEPLKYLKLEIKNYGKGNYALRDLAGK